MTDYPFDSWTKWRWKDMEDVSDLSDFFLEAVEKAAIASARWRGKGDKIKADDAAV